MTKEITTKSSNPAGVLKRSNAYFIDPTRVVRRDGWNPRFDFGEIEEMAKSILANGLLNAIRVKRISGNPAADFELIDGDRRMTAIEHLIKKGHVFAEGVPATIVSKEQDDLTSLIQMFEANTGKPFLPLEEAAAYKRLQDHGMTIAQICQAVSRKQVHVVEMLGLLKADDSVKEAAQSGEIGKTLAKKIAKVAKGDAATQKKLVAKAKAAGSDKTKMRQVMKDVEDVRHKRAEAQGKVIRQQGLDYDELEALGTQVAGLLLERLEALGHPLDFDVRHMIAKDDRYALAFTYGAMEAIKAARGGAVNLVV